MLHNKWVQPEISPLDTLNIYNASFASARNTQRALGDRPTPQLFAAKVAESSITQRNFVNVIQFMRVRTHNQTVDTLQDLQALTPPLRIWLKPAHVNVPANK